MPRRADPGARALAAALALAAAAGCSTLPRGPTAAAAPAGAPPAERQVMVLLRSTHPAVWQGLARDLTAFEGLALLASWPMESLGEQCLVFALPAGGERAALLARLAADRRVGAAQPVARFHTLGAPWNDAYAALQPDLEALGLAAAHRWATGRGVHVALVDTGVDVAHPELEGRVKTAKSFVPRGDDSFGADVHGTAVAGVLAAGADNGIGIVGVAPGSELAALKACWPDPPGSRQAACDSYSLARALDFALGARPRVLNLSLGGPEDPLLARLLARAEQLGILVVAAADPTGAAPFPASLPTVLGVAALETPAPAADLAASGADVLSIGPRGGYDFFAGSSFAAAQVAGVAALLVESRPELGPAELRRLLAAGARPPVTPGGSPLLSACGALGAALGRDLCAEPAP